MRKKTLAALVLSLGNLAYNQSCNQTNLIQDKTPTVVERICEYYLLSEGIFLGSKLWEELKGGKHKGGVGRDGKQWKEYLSKIENYRNDVLEKLKPKIREEMEKYPFYICDLGRGGNWTTSRSEGGEWDDFSDLDKVKFYGVCLGYSTAEPDEVERSVLVHEYFHGIWDIFGAFAGKETRKINRDQFRSDTERLVHDLKYKNSPLRERLKVGWRLNEGKEETERMRKMFPEDIGADGTIPQFLTERFAYLSEFYYDEPGQLPEYAQKYFKPFFK